MTDITQTPQTLSTTNTKTEKQVQWPLRFRSHNFSKVCFDVQSCQIRYGTTPFFPSDKSYPSLASYGRPMEDMISGKIIAIANFPPPVQITWKSKDGTPLSAQIDIAKIFSDGLIRHNLKKEEISENTLKSDLSPDIVIEVNDRTVNVYMRAFLSTKTEQRPGNKHSNFRNDLVKAFSQTY